MDFHSLTRRELQTLCKKNKVPANITNVAMADALKSLQFVEGIEELLNPSESVTAQSSIESPGKMEVTSPLCVPRTGCRSISTRQKTVREVENSQTLTRTRRSIRILAETPAASNKGKAPVASFCRKMDAELKDVSDAPSVLPSSRRRGQKLMDENTVTRTYSTRQSARLAEKNANKKRIESVLFLDESEENVEIPEKIVEESLNDLEEIIESTDIDLKKETEGEMERNKVEEIRSDNKSDGSNEDQIQFDSSKLVMESNESFEAVNPKMTIEDNGVEYRADDDLKIEVHSEVLEVTDPSADTLDELLQMQDAVQEKSSGDLYLNKNEEEEALENGDNLNVNHEMVSEKLAAETVENVALAQDEDAFNTEDKTLEINDLTEDGNSGSMIEEVHENAKVENDVGFLAMSADNVEVDQCSKDLAALDINCGAVTKEDEKPVAEESVVVIQESNEQGNLSSAQELLVKSALEEECVDNNMLKDTTPQDLNAPSDLPELTSSDDDVVGSPESTATDDEDDDVVESSEFSVSDDDDVVGSSESTASDDEEDDVVESSESTASDDDDDDDVVESSDLTATDDEDHDVVESSDLTATDDEDHDVVESSEEEYVYNNMMKETTAEEWNICGDLLPELPAFDGESDDVVVSSGEQTTPSVDLLPELPASDDDDNEEGHDVVQSLSEEYVDNNVMKETESTTTAQDLNASADLLLLPKLPASESDDGNDEIVGSPEDEEYAPDYNNNVIPTTMESIKPLDDASSLKKSSPIIKQLGGEGEGIQNSPANNDFPLFSHANTAREFSVNNSVLQETELNNNNNNVLLLLQSSLTTPAKKSATTITPMKKSGSKKTPKKLNHIFDDKENINSSGGGGSKLILHLTKEKKNKKKNKDLGQSTTTSTTTEYVDVSLRKLKKELKDKLLVEKKTGGKNLKKVEEEEEVEKKMVGVSSSRPALQAVSENMMIEKE